MKKILSILVILILVLQADITSFADSTNEVNSRGKAIFYDWDEISDWAKPEVLEAYSRGLFNGIGEKNGKVVFDPHGTFTIGEAFTMINRMVDHKDLDVRENIEKLGYPVTHLVGYIPDYIRSNNDIGAYMDYYLERSKSYYASYVEQKGYGGDRGLANSLGVYTRSPILLSEYYSAEFISQFEGHPDNRSIALELWPKEFSEVPVKKEEYKSWDIKKQIKYIVDLDIVRLKALRSENNILANYFKDITMLYTYTLRYSFENPGPVGSDVFGHCGDQNTLDERHYTQLLINEQLYPNLPRKDHWAYPQYEKLTELMYLNGFLREEDISFDTEIQKDQLASLMYWMLATSGQTFDWSSVAPYIVERYLQTYNPYFEGFTNIPKNPDYVYSTALTQLKEIGILNGSGNDTINYESKIPREQVAALFNRLYDYAKDYENMRTYNNNGQKAPHFMASNEGGKEYSSELPSDLPISTSTFGPTKNKFIELLVSEKSGGIKDYSDVPPVLKYFWKDGIYQ